MNIEAGKCYFARDGSIFLVSLRHNYHGSSKVGNRITEGCTRQGWGSDDEDVWSFTSNGSCPMLPDWDLIEEIPQEETTRIIMLRELKK